MDGNVYAVIGVNTLADLRTLPGNPNSLVLLLGRDSISDGLGGIYRWDATSTEAEILTYMPIIAVTGVTTGRWKRTYLNTITYPQGTLVIHGGIKTFYVASTTNSSGEAAINLTTDNTTTGPAIFSEIWFNYSRANSAATNITSAVQSYEKTTSADLKMTTHGFYKVNPITLAVGILYNPATSIGAGVSVQFKIEGK